MAGAFILTNSARTRMDFIFPNIDIQLWRIHPISASQIYQQHSLIYICYIIPTAIFISWLKIRWSIKSDSWSMFIISLLGGEWQLELVKVPDLLTNNTYWRCKCAKWIYIRLYHVSSDSACKWSFAENRSNVPQVQLTHGMWIRIYTYMVKKFLEYQVSDFCYNHKSHKI